jgi:hypothetical protein
VGSTGAVAIIVQSILPPWLLKLGVGPGYASVVSRFVCLEIGVIWPQSLIFAIETVVIRRHGSQREN